MSKQFHVSRIIDEYRIIINGGLSDGIVEGAVLSITRLTKIPLVDPITNEELGQLKPEKIRIVASEVHKKYSICSSTKTFNWPLFSKALFGGTKAALKGLTTYETSPKPLPIDPLDMQGMPDLDVPIKIGDLVELVSLPSTSPEGLSSGEENPPSDKNSGHVDIGGNSGFDNQNGESGSTDSNE